jgi:hypothetical protein
MERQDLFQDDLTEERYPSPARRDDAASTQVLDPDAPDADTVRPPQDALAGKAALGYPHGVPGGVHGDPEAGDDDDDDDEEDEDDEDVEG